MKFFGIDKGSDDGDMTRFTHQATGDIVDMPQPDALGNGVILHNGRLVLRVHYGNSPPSVTLEDGRTITPKEFTDYIIEILNSGAWSNAARNQDFNRECGGCGFHWLAFDVGPESAKCPRCWDPTRKNQA